MGLETVGVGWGERGRTSMTRGGRDDLLSDVVRLWRARAGRRSRSRLSVSRVHGWLVGGLSEGEGEGGESERDWSLRLHRKRQFRDLL